MQKMIRPPKPDWWEEEVNERNIDNNITLIPKICRYLLDATQEHSAYTDRKMVHGEPVRVDFFNSKIENKWDWNNIFIVEAFHNSLRPYKSSLFHSYEEEILLRPDAEDYYFDRYFEIDFETGKILPKIVNSGDSFVDFEEPRARTTIDILKLNEEWLCKERKQELKKYIDLQRLLEKEGAVLDNEEQSRLNINNYSFRFYLERGIKAFQQKSHNEYINSLLIEKYFGIESLKITNLVNKKEIFLLGENGVGKTLVLQAIALSSYELDTKFLFKYLDASETDNFKITVTDEAQNKYHFNPLINRYTNTVLAYGISRLNEGKGEENAVLSLFKRDATLINPIEWLKEVDYKKLKGIGTLTLEQAKNILTYFLDEEVKIEENAKGDFLFKEKGTTVHHFSQLSDGYRSVLIWLSDLLSRLAERNPSISDPKEYKATVMVDEIGEYLHPTWEYGIVQKLRKAFPKIQWIFTTHSPVVVLGASKDAVLYKLYKENGITKVSEPYPISAFSNYLIDGFATSPLFNLPTSRPVSFEGDEYELETGNYLYDKIHEEVLKRLKVKPLQNTELKNMINELLDKYEKEGVL